MQRLIPIDSRTYAAGLHPFPLAAVSKMKRVQGIAVILDVLFTHGAAAAAIVSDQLFRLFEAITLGRLVDTTGLGLHNLDWQQRGHETYLPAGIPATNAGTFRRRIRVDLPWFDESAESPGDLPPQSEENQDKNLAVKIPAFAGLDAATWGTLASIAGTIDVFAVVDDSSGQVNPKVRIGFVDASSQSPTLPAGLLYDYVWMQNEDGSGITSAEITGISGKADGEPFLDKQTLSQVVETWNQQKASHGGVRAASATAPVAGGKLTHEPAFTSGAAATVTTEFLPLIWRRAKGKLSQAVPVFQGLTFQFSGTKTAIRLHYKAVEAHDESSVAASFRKIGAPITSLRQVTPKTSSKAPLKKAREYLASFLPLRKIG